MQCSVCQRNELHNSREATPERNELNNSTEETSYCGANKLLNKLVQERQLQRRRLRTTSKSSLTGWRSRLRRARRRLHRKCCSWSILSGLLKKVQERQLQRRRLRTTSKSSLGLRNELTIAVSVVSAFNFVLHVVIKIYKKMLVEHWELHLDLQGDAVTYLEYSECSTCSNSVFL